MAFKWHGHFTEFSCDKCGETKSIEKAVKFNFNRKTGWAKCRDCHKKYLVERRALIRVRKKFRRKKQKEFRAVYFGPPSGRREIGKRPATNKKKVGSSNFLWKNAAGHNNCNIEAF